MPSKTQQRRQAPDYDGGLPYSVDAERLVLGSILAGRSEFAPVAQSLEANNFHLEKNRRIFARMAELYEKGQRIDLVTVAEALRRHKELASVDGLTYLSYSATVSRRLWGRKARLPF